MGVLAWFEDIANRFLSPILLFGNVTYNNQVVHDELSWQSCGGTNIDVSECTPSLYRHTPKLHYLEILKNCSFSGSWVGEREPAQHAEHYVLLISISTILDINFILSPVPFSIYIHIPFLLLTIPEYLCGHEENEPYSS